MPSSITSAAENKLTKAVIELLSEGRVGALQREQSAFDRVAALSGDALVLFGAGNFGRFTLARLRRAGFEPLAFADNNPRLWDTSVEGLKVLSPEAASLRYGTRATFVITIWTGEANDRMAQREDQLRKLGCRHVVQFPPLFWKFPDRLLPHFAVELPHKIHGQADQVLAACSLWEDDLSRQEYLAQLRWRLFGNVNCLPDPVKEKIYFPRNLWRLTDSETFIDCGAYDGDTIATFLDETRGLFQSIFGFEPDPDNFAQLARRMSAISQRECIKLQQAAVGSREGLVPFSASANETSRVGLGEQLVNCITLDTVLAAIKPTYIKMDIEGSELEALAGGRALIRKYSPVLAISSYHCQDHLWKIPLFIKTLNPEYRLFLRPHRSEGWDLVTYAIPPSCLLGESDDERRIFRSFNTDKTSLD